MNIVFQASAGTGKTHQVTHLYVSLLLGRRYETRGADGKPVLLHNPDGATAADPRRLLLMTFTENAAAELRTRVTELILKARQEAEDAGNSDEIDKTVRILRALPSAPICTIHSFCASFLREHALEAGISPAFGVMDQDEAEELLEETAREELLARLNPDPDSPERAYDPDFAAFCESARVLGGDYGNSVTDTVRNLLRQADSKGIALDRAEEMLPPAEHTVAPADFLTILERLARVRSERGGKLPDRAAQIFQTLENIARDFPIIGKTGDADTFFREIAQASFTSFAGKEPLPELSRELKRLHSSVVTVLNYRRNLDRIRAFARYAAAVARRYAERKLQLGALDFDDLLVRARDLLRHRGDAARLFDCIIVDEVQDTSRVQCEIIERLWDPAVNALVICGDTKQSIYAWRNADPRVMLDLAQRIAGAPRQQCVPLRASFRSKDAILDFVNLLFARIYEDGAYRETDRLVPSESKRAAVRALGETPCVELLAPDEEAEPDDVQDDASEEVEPPDRKQRVKDEMTAIARRVQLLVNGPPDWRPKYRYAESGVFEPAAGENAFRYSDVFILLRRTTNQQVLEHVLRQHGIPYRISGRGKGLFARPEAKDVLLFFRVLLHPSDAISLLGFLRSPWAGIADDTILQLGWKEDGFDEARFRQNVLAPGNGTPVLDGEQGRRLDRARRLIALFRARLDYELPSELLRKLIAETAYDAVLAGCFRGGQRLCNLRKMIDWIRGTERGGTVLPADVCALLQAHADSPPDVPEATMLDPAQNAVTIMTIHAAKGLTARVVFVPETGSPLPGETAWAVLDSRAGDAQAALHVCTEDLVRSKVPTPGFDEARLRVKEIRTEEARNLFYVAMTRARDLVVITGCPGRSKNTWRTRIDELVAEEASGAPGLLRHVPYGDIAAAFAEADDAGRSHVARVLPDLAALDAASAQLPKPVEFPLVLRYPATALCAFHADPSSFARLDVPRNAPLLSQPDSPDSAEDPSPTDRDDVASAALFGTAGHAVLEQLALRNWKGDIPALIRAAAMSADLDPAVQDELRARIEKCVPVIRRLVGGARDCRAEWPFAMTVVHPGGTLIVDGTLDLLFAAENGVRQIVDYKFTDDEPAHLIQRYGLQLNLYREAVSRIPRATQAPPAAWIVAIGSSGSRLVEIPEDPEVMRLVAKAGLGLSRAAAEARDAAYRLTFA